MSEKKSFVKFLVILFPFSLIGMVIGSLLLHEMRRVDKQEETPMSQPITASALIDHYKKLEEYMTPRGMTNEEDVDRLLRTSKYIESSLSYLNTGLNLQSEKELVEMGKVWQKYTFAVNEDKGAETLNFDYMKAGNVELACALAYAEALPQTRHKVSVAFTPTEGSAETFIRKESELAEKMGQGNALCYDGVDWEYLAETLQEALKE